jgi:hypothetical protein
LHGNAEVLGKTPLPPRDDGRQHRSRQHRAAEHAAKQRLRRRRQYQQQPAEGEQAGRELQGDERRRREVPAGEIEPRTERAVLGPPVRQGDGRARQTAAQFRHFAATASVAGDCGALSKRA